LNPYPIRYRPAFACSDLLYPLVHRRTLAGDVPPSLRERSGLPRFARVPLPKGLGPASPPAVRHLRGANIGSPDLTAHLLVHASQPLWHVLSNDGSSAVHLSWPYPSTPAPGHLVGWQSQPPLAVQLPAHRAEATVSRTLRTPGLPPTHGPVGYRWQNTGS